ncbi:hypothetical protein ACFR9U_13505 [Halorientalis brevis]|uniref:Uncharacterized protein n=1 Tax=Halorientalis brevis TaxID=1126241 RepID=A0ABD6CCN3_9EURY|nr:hypothetical protein [Halorientalis brevis]
MTDQRETIQEAIREIRREGYKAAGMHAVVDAVAVFLLVNLGVLVAGVSLPPVGPIDGSTVLAAVVGLLAFGVEFGLRVHYYTVERFEATNPEVAEALRTARDAAEAADGSPMAARLYDDVIAKLKGTSAAGFVDTRWLGGSVVVVLLVSVLTIQAAVAGISLGPAAGPPANETDERTPGGPVSSTDNGDSRLQDGDDVLGEPKDVDRGDDDLSTNISAGRGGQEGDEEHAYDDSGFVADTDPVAAQRAGYDAEQNLGDADLVREYNLRLNARDSDD